MKRFCFIFLASAVCAIGQTTVDFFLDVEAGVSGQNITTAALEAGTHTAPSTGYWLLNRGPYGVPAWGTLTSVTGFGYRTTAKAIKLRSPITIRGTGVTYDTECTKLIAYSMLNRAQLAGWQWTSGYKAKVSVGYYYAMCDDSNPSKALGNVVSTQMRAGAPNWGGDYDIMGGGNGWSGTNYHINVHTYASGPTEIPIHYGKVYWIAQLWDGVAGMARVRVYDPDTWTQVGSESALPLTKANCGVYFFGEGMPQTDPKLAVTNFFGNIIMDWTTATYPLLLPAASPATDPPAITVQPAGTTNSTIGGFSLSVTATGSGTLSYQWRTNSINVSGATSAAYAPSPATTNHSGDYTVLITNAYGSVTSQVATVLITNIVTTNAIVAASRLGPWRGNVGIPGGIPIRTNIYQVFSSGASQSSIQTALNSAPSNSVIYLSDGTYDIAGQLSVPTGKTLRGAGIGKTILRATGSTYCVVGMGRINNDWGSGQTSVSVTATVPQGATNLTVSSASTISVGNLLQLNELNDSSIPVSAVGDEGTATWVDGWSGTRVAGQTVEVTGISGTNIYFTPPAYWTYSNSLSPLVVPYTCQVRYAGVEDLTVFASPTSGQNFVLGNVAYCWLKNVEGNFVGQWGTDGADHVVMAASLRCEVRHSYFHDGFYHGPSSWGVQSVTMVKKASGCLVEDNIFWRLLTSCLTSWGASGNVIAYNYSTNVYYTDNLTWSQKDINFCHGAHTMFNLAEGNVCTFLLGDSTWGTSSHNTMLRNYSSAENWYTTPEDARYGGSTNTPLPAPINLVTATGRMTDQEVGVFATSRTRYYNIVGNMVGSTYVANNSSTTYLATNASYSPNDDVPWEYVIGPAGAGGSTVAAVWNTTVFEGNWDARLNAQHWYSSNPDTEIPDSYYLDAKPSYFAACPWPPVDPANPTAFSATNIPAGYRFVYGADPEDPGSVPPSITTQPSGVTNSTGTGFSLSVVASGTAPLAYQWRTNSVNLAGATNATYASTPATTNQSGDYTVVVTNSYGLATSVVAVVLITNIVTEPPVVITQPVGVTNSTGNGFNLSVTADGTEPLAYQWMTNGVEVSAATNFVYIKIPALPSHSGNYTVRITNSYGNVTSDVAAVSISGVPPTITIAPYGVSNTPAVGFSLTVAAGGDTPLLYQWSTNGVNLAAGTNATYSKVPAVASDSGDYVVVVTNDYGSVTSTPVTVLIATPPTNVLGLTFSATNAYQFVEGSGGSWSIIGNYIQNGTETTTPSEGGAASYLFNVTNAGDYVVAVTYLAPNTASDSVFVNIDAAPTTPLCIWDAQTTGALATNYVTWRGTGGPQFNPIVFSNLNAGPHELTLVGREAGMQLYRFTIERTNAPPAPATIKVIGGRATFGGRVQM